MSPVGKKLSAFAAHSTAFTGLITVLERTGSNRPNLLQVLTYHDVEAPDAFAQQMNYLARNYHTVSAEELLAVFEGRQVLPPRSVMVTFDDAYCSFAEDAWPILKYYNVPATLFVPTAFPDHPERVFWWDELQHAVRQTRRRDVIEMPFGRFSLRTPSERARLFRRSRDFVKSLPHARAVAWVGGFREELGVAPMENRVLGWAALRQLAREGVTLGAHTQTHPLMNRVTLEEARAEAAGSRRDLQREIGSVLPIFAYPSGNFNDDIVEILGQEGFALAFTTIRGTNEVCSTDPLRLRRNNIGQQATLNVLRTRLLQSSVYFNQLRPLSGRH